MKKNYFILLLCCFSANSQISLPYTTTFNNPASDESWTHYAIAGTDNWERGFASGNTIDGDLSWESNLNGTPTVSSNMALESPAYDLTNANLPYVLSFKYRSLINSNNNLYLEYTLDNGTSWLLLNSTTTLKKNWQSTGGFTMSSSGFGYSSSLNLSFLAGNASVKFRFRFKTSTYCNGYGVVIDDFSIAQEYYNVYASAGTSIDISALCTDLNVKTSLNFSNQYSNYFNITTKYYLSNDTTLDGNDMLLGEKILR